MYLINTIEVPKLECRITGQELKVPEKPSSIQVLDVFSKVFGDSKKQKINLSLKKDSHTIQSIYDPITNNNLIYNTWVPSETIFRDDKPRIDLSLK